MHTALHAAAHGVVELQPRLARFVEPGHQHVVQSAHVVGPAHKLRTHQVAAALEGPAHAVVVLLRGGGEVADEEHLVVLLSGPDAQLQAADCREALGLEVLQRRLVAQLDGLARLAVAHDEVPARRVPLVEGRGELGLLLLPLRARLLGLHDRRHGDLRVLAVAVAAARVAVAARGAGAGARQARARDGAPEVALAVHREAPAPVDERVEVAVDRAVVGGPGEPQQGRGGGEHLEEGDAARCAIVTLRLPIELHQRCLDLHHRAWKA
mmetsp:Transcript_42392/g.128366  ORF Transcript_42392/g.128366 Transcript_42392/m.128366 type:complete len:267 (-) Transcript_42392:56-856(-)